MLDATDDVKIEQMNEKHQRGIPYKCEKMLR